MPTAKTDYKILNCRKIDSKNFDNLKLSKKKIGEIFKCEFQFNFQWKKKTSEENRIESKDDIYNFLRWFSKFFRRDFFTFHTIF